MKWGWGGGGRRKAYGTDKIDLTGALLGQNPNLELVWGPLTHTCTAWRSWGEIYGLAKASPLTLVHVTVL